MYTWAVHEEVTVDIDAPPDHVWEVMTDIERWPEWTPSVTRAEMLTEGPLVQGARARLLQPKAPSAVWTVTSVEPGAAFTWETSSPALTSIASHRIERTGDGSRVTLSVTHSGLFAVLLGWWLGPLTRRYIAMEAQGLKARSEKHNGYAI